MYDHAGMSACKHCASLLDETSGEAVRDRQGAPKTTRFHVSGRVLTSASRTAGVPMLVEGRRADWQQNQLVNPCECQRAEGSPGLSTTSAHSAVGAHSGADQYGNMMRHGPDPVPCSPSWQQSSSGAWQAAQGAHAVTSDIKGLASQLPMAIGGLGYQAQQEPQPPASLPSRAIAHPPGQHAALRARAGCSVGECGAPGARGACLRAAAQPCWSR